MYGTQVAYRNYPFGSTFIYFRIGINNFRITVNDNLTLDEIMALPEGMFDPTDSAEL